MTMKRSHSRVDAELRSRTASPSAPYVRAAQFALLAALGSLGLGAKGCDGDLVDDPTFHEWCGESLCAWKLEQGSVRKAPTWHPKDYGVEFVDTPTAISQDVDDRPACLLFTTMADVDVSAELWLEIDFNRDGVVDYTQPIAATGFRVAENEIPAPLFYDGFRIVLRKKGEGHAVLAQIRVQQKKNCAGDAPVLHDLPLGATCSMADQDSCTSGVCCSSVCSECCDEKGIGQTLPDGGDVGNPETGCAAGGVCKRRADGLRGPSFLQSVPEQCNPGAKDRPSGSICLANDDCASGACDGAHATTLCAAGDAGTAGEAPFPDAGANCLFTHVYEGHCR
jgi:hypothetical protein